MSTDEFRFNSAPETVRAFREEFADVLACDPSEVGVHGAVHIDDTGLVTVRTEHGWADRVWTWFTD